MQRVAGVDVARGLAVLGMFTAHLGDDAGGDWTRTGWLQVADGRSAAGFALLAGVSAAFLSGGPRVASGAALDHARVRIVVRALALLPLGVVLSLLGTPVAVILPGYAVMFSLVTVALTWRTRTLLLAAAGFASVGSAVVVVLRDAFTSGPFGGVPPGLDLLVGEHYPAGAWMAYLLVGLAVGRTDLLAPRTPLVLLGVGLPTAVLGYGVGAVAVRGIAPDQTLRRALLTAEPHADTVTEITGNVGVVLCVLALCLLLARYAGRVVAPLAATGSLALTLYVGHILVIAVMGPMVVWDPSNARLLAFVVTGVAFATVWRALLGRGPLERGLHSLSTTVADHLAPTGRRGWAPPAPYAGTPTGPYHGGLAGSRSAWPPPPP